METNTSAHLARRVLIGRIEQLGLGPADAQLTFERRLAAENGWTEAFATLVTREYRRFIALIAVGGVEATPSDAVDQAWHLHLTYTRSYWVDMCRDVLGREIHHDPTTGGAERREHYRERYAATLSAYMVMFGIEPPAEVWPEPSKRFSSRFVRIDARRRFVTGGNAIGLSGFALLGIAVMTMVGWTALPVVVALVAAVLAIATAVNLDAGTWEGGSSLELSTGGGCGADASGGGDGGCGSGCGGGGCGGCG